MAFVLEFGLGFHSLEQAGLGADEFAKQARSFGGRFVEFGMFISAFLWLFATGGLFEPQPISDLDRGVHGGDDSSDDGGVCWGHGVGSISFTFRDKDFTFSLIAYAKAGISFRPVRL